jgi:hypothetical protein
MGAGGQPALGGAPNKEGGPLASSKIRGLQPKNEGMLQG